MNYNSFAIIMLAIGLLSQSVTCILLWRRVSRLEDRLLCLFLTFIPDFGDDSDEDISIPDQD